MAEQIFEKLAAEFREHIPHHHHDPPPLAAQIAAARTSQAPAAQPVNLQAAAPAAQLEEPVSLVTTIEDDVKNDLSEGLDYITAMAGRLKAAAPGIISTVETVGNSTIGKLAEGLAETVIPEPYEGMLVNLVKDFAQRYGMPATPPPAQPAAPALSAQ